MKPPGARAILVCRTGRGPHRHLEVTWNGLRYDDGVCAEGWIDLGPVPDLLSLDGHALDWAELVDWASVRELYLGEETARP